MSSREFPFSPRSATKLEVADVLAIPCEEGTRAVLQVSSLRRTGPGAWTTLSVGVTHARHLMRGSPRCRTVLARAKPCPAESAWRSGDCTWSATLAARVQPRLRQGLP